MLPRLPHYSGSSVGVRETASLGALPASVDTFSSDAQKRHTVVPRTVRCPTSGVTERTMGKRPLEGVESDSSATLRISITFLIAG